MLPERYDPLLVALSYLVALLGSYTALSMAARLPGPSGGLRLPWLLGGALAQATGIWSMHFTGMLAFSLPVPIAYHVGLVTVSFVIALLGSIPALVLTHRPELSTGALVAGGLFIGAGIGGLHFTDMAAMRMAAQTRYSHPLVAMSVVIAVLFGLLSLWLGRRYRRDDPLRSRWSLVIGALIMAAAIWGQHYTAMAAADFTSGPDTRLTSVGSLLSAGDTSMTVVMATIAILGATLGSAGIDRRMGARAAVSRRLLVAQEAERRRIARVLHEDVGQLLTALRLNLQRVTPDPQNVTVLADSITLVDDVLARVRALSVELRPSVLDDLGLAAAIRWYANRQAERAGYAVVVEEVLGERRVPAEVETAAFRIVQQALTNIARHARAHNVHIALRRAQRDLEVVVSDDGVGFDVSAARQHAEAGASLGLLDMTELAESARGTLSVTSVAGKGSIVHIRFLLERP